MRNAITSFLLLICLTASGQNPTIENLWKQYQSGDYDLVIEKAIALRDSDPDNPDLSLLLGRAYADNGDYQEALPYLRFTVTNDSTGSFRKAWALGYLGTCYFMTQEDDKSNKALRACIDLNATRNATQYAGKRIALFGYDDFYKGWKTRESEHFKFHFQNLADAHIEQFISLREEAYKSINSFFQSKMPAKINFFVWASTEDARQILRTNPGFADPKLCIVHSLDHQTKGHEMTHVISHYTANIIAKTALINEGTAACFDQDGKNRERIVKDWIKANNRTIAIKDLWINWKSFPEEFSYPLSALFVRNLIDEFGKAKFLEFFTNQTYENAKSVFGARFDETIQEFEDRINNLKALH